jgi:GT2 family glycosyltransferase
VEPAVLAATSDNAVEALASCAGENDSVATIVVPLVDIGYEDVLALGVQMRHGIRHLSAQFPMTQSAGGEICVNIHIFVGVWGLCGLDIQPISDSIGFMDCLTDAIAERQITIRATASSSQLINGVFSHDGDSLSPGMAVELTVIVPTLDANSQRFRRLYRSLYDSTDVPFQLVIVDNGKSAQGFTEPVNAGIRACTTRYAVVVNDDVTFASGWWSPLCAALESGSWVVFPMTDGNTRADFSAWCFAIDLDHFDEYAHSEHELFDPQLRIWFQDSDLYLKLLDAEHPPKLVEESHISHELSATVNTRDAMLSQWIYDVIIDDKAHFVERWGLQGLERVGFACDETNQVRYLEESSGS